jgi:predicted PurR-regulated permease PerM
LNLRGNVDELTVPVHVRTTAATVVFLSVALFVLREGADLFTPVLLSVLLAYALGPAVNLFVRFRLPRPAAVVLVYGLVAALAAGTVRAVRPQVAALVDELPDTASALSHALGRHLRPSGGPSQSPFDRLQRAADDLRAAIDSSVAKPPPNVARVTVVHRFRLAEYLIDAWTVVLAAGARVIVIAVLTFVLLLGSERARQKLVAFGGAGFERRKITREVLREIDLQIERYFLARILISAIVAGATAAGMRALGVREPLALGLAAGVLNVLPFVGPSIGVAICGVVAFVQFQSGDMAAAAVLVSGLIAALEGNLITPWLTSRAGELNTVAVFVSVLFWGWMWDVWGLLLAVPIMVAVKAAADHIEPLQPLGELLGQ